MDETVDRMIAKYLLGTGISSTASYRRVLAEWCKWCSDNGLDMLDAQRWHIEAYGRWLLECLGKSRRTVTAAYTPICGFYRYAYEEGWIDRDPGAMIRRPRIRSWSDGSWLTPDEARDFLRLAEEDPRGFVPAACCLLLLNGLRVGEVIGLDVADWRVRGGSRVVHVRRKFDWMQDVAVSDRTAAAITRAVGSRKTGPLLVDSGRRLTEQKLLRVVVALGVRVGAEVRITPHSLRRTFATVCRLRGVPDRAIMASGGWSSREMIDYYDMGRLGLENEAAQEVTNFLS